MRRTRLKMPRLRIEPGGVELRVPAGERVLDLADDHPELGLPTACRAANCGTCRVEVAAGERWLLPPGERERRELRQLAAAPGERLGCQICISREASSDGLVVLRLPG